MHRLIPKYVRFVPVRQVRYLFDQPPNVVLPCQGMIHVVLRSAGRRLLLGFETVDYAPDLLGRRLKRASLFDIQAKAQVECS